MISKTEFITNEVASLAMQKHHILYDNLPITLQEALWSIASRKYQGYCALTSTNTTKGGKG